MKSYPLAILVLVVSWFSISLLHAEETYKSEADSAFPYNLEIKKSYPKNMLTNGDFGVMKPGERIPADWFEMNPLQTEAVKYATKTDKKDKRNYVNITSTEDAPAYIGHPMTVQEGNRYYCSVYSRFDGACEFLLRVFTDQYTDSGSWSDKSSNTEVRDTANPGQGEGLEDFLDQKFLNMVSRDKWAKRELEFTVPKGHKIDTYYFTCGIYGYGFTDLSYAYAAPAAFGLTVKVAGENIKSIRITDLSKKVYAESATDIVDVMLPTRLAHYFVEVTDTNQKIYRRSIQ